MGRDVVREALNTIAVGLRRSCGVEGRGCGFVDVDLCGDRRRMFPVQFCRTADLINEQYGLVGRVFARSEGGRSWGDDAYCRGVHRLPGYFV